MAGGKRKRRRLVEEQFTQAVEDLDLQMSVIREKVQHALGDKESPELEGTYLWLAEAQRKLLRVIQGNFDSVLRERKTDQDIAESRHRIATDRELRRQLEELVPANFVSVELMRERIRGRLTEMGFPFADQFLDWVCPVPVRRGYVEDLLAAWRAENETADGEDE